MNNDGIQIRLGDILHVIFKRRRLIFFMTLLGLILGLMLFGLSYIQGEMSSEYTINASISIAPVRADGTFANGSSGPNDDDYTLAMDMREGTSYLMKSTKVLSSVIEKRQLIGLTVKDIKNNLTIKSEDDAPVLDLSLTWRSVDEGTAVLNAIITETESAMLDTYYMGKLTIIDTPESSYWSLGAKIGASVWLLLAAAGFVIGIGIAVLELLMNPTILNIRDVRTMLELDTIAVIPKDARAFNLDGMSLLEASMKNAQIKQNYSGAAHILYNRLRRQKNCQCLYVTSAASGEGRTAAAANLAMELAALERKVLLVDLDFKNPGAGSLFLKNVDYDYSLNAYYRGDCKLEEAIRPLTGYLSVLPAVMEHNMLAYDNTVLDLISTLKKQYEYIIIDTSAVGEVSDVLSLNSVAEFALFVIRYDYSPIARIQESLDLMDKSGIHIIGCIVNEYSGSNAVNMTRRMTGEDKSTIYRTNTSAKTDFYESARRDDIVRDYGEPDEDDTTDNLIGALTRGDGETGATYGETGDDSDLMDLKMTAAAGKAGNEVPAAGAAAGTSPAVTETDAGTENNAGVGTGADHAAGKEGGTAAVSLGQSGEDAAEADDYHLETVTVPDEDKK